jgi:hypothetical protein
VGRHAEGSHPGGMRARRREDGIRLLRKGRHGLRVDVIVVIVGADDRRYDTARVPRGKQRRYAAAFNAAQERVDQGNGGAELHDVRGLAEPPERRLVPARADIVEESRSLFHGRGG